MRKYTKKMQQNEYVIESNLSMRVKRQTDSINKKLNIDHKNIATNPYRLLLYEYILAKLLQIGKAIKTLCSKKLNRDCYINTNTFT